MRAHAAPTLWSQLAWFVGLWLAGVGSVGLVSLVLRAWLR
jgi:hypothetical protein